MGLVKSELKIINPLLNQRGIILNMKTPITYSLWWPAYNLWDDMQGPVPELWDIIQEMFAPPLLVVNIIMVVDSKVICTPECEVRGPED